ncbi:uncharacterized protein LOC110895424 [Helianthus annuus]|uniref:uncharacterized protein LOC110895424 n=1 Tax=Helianthus annuus TaxID=4232 RepID=UPI000B8FB8A9|nr:uncharacterized protein LOC110895424 [Helianthus annuus]
MGDNEAPVRRVVADYARPNAANARSSITRPAIGVNRWQIPPEIITMVTNTIQFHGLPYEDPNVHISRFSAICDTFQEQGVSEDACKLRLFPFSLADRAHAWLESLPAGSITTWAGTKDKFLGKYFPPAKTARLRSMIQEFRQKEGESFYETWERFKELLLKCPHHGFEDWALVEKFYYGVTPATRNMLNTTAGGNLMTAKTPEECMDMFEDIAMSSYEFPDSRQTTFTQRWVHRVDEVTRMQAQIDALQKQVGDMKVQKEQVCEICTGRHDTTACPIAPVESPEQVELVGNRNQNNFGDRYNSNWKNHPNSSWKNSNPPGFQPRQSLFQDAGAGASSGTKNPTIEEMLRQNQETLAQQTQLLTQFITQGDTRHRETQARFLEHETYMKNQSAAFQNLERTVGAMSEKLNQRPPGGLPSSTVENPNATAKAVTTRSGRGAVEVESVVDEDPEVDEEIEMETPAGKVHPRLRLASTAQSSGSPVEKKDAEKEPMRVYKPTPPYPGRLIKGKDAEQYGKFLEMLKKLHVNIPFVEALSKMPKYAKFLKDFLTNKKKLEDLSTVTLSEECSAVLQNKLPKKVSDPGSFTIPCLIGNLIVSNALADLGASINLMPYSIFAKLNLGEPYPTRMSLQLADRSVKFPRGIVEYMLVKVDKFVFPVDFIILDMDEDSEVPLILGRPFLATARALIDVYDGKLTLRVDEDKVTFAIQHSMRHTQQHDDTLYFIDTLMSHVGSLLSEICERDASDTQVASVDDQGSRVTELDVEQDPLLQATEPFPRFEVFEVIKEEDKMVDEFDSWPVKEADVGFPLTPTTTREKAQRSLDQHVLRVQRWYKKKEEPLKFAQHHSPHYMPRIKFGPGLDMYHPYSISIRVISELHTNFKEFTKCTS